MSNRDEIDRLTDAQLMHNIRCAENVLAHPEDFPHADLERTREHWLELCVAGVGRALPELMQ
jgi:hypothetical protein